HCLPLPGHEVIGFKEKDGSITLHRRDCQHVISQAAQQGDRITNVLFPECESVSYPVKTRIRGVDRYHILQDIVSCLSDTIGVSLTGLNIETREEIFDCVISYNVHSADELRRALRYLAAIDGIDEISK
ncbi:MAG: bifunctional (p)ppGpp synthetase/guanosine-3',5'-bis(diphosphate) 3'-pyrophosphohydrolase, partial [Bacteroidales bacterium]|nr:bifunctional (p)ppGpp synthetase/guanosine-3',5'-bis(diphosphate) 3'-pyrophosphohydrolase [Bacteroidales bacterium]